MVNIVLVQPPIHQQSAVFGFMEPYALEVLATSLLQDNELKDKVNIKIFDLRVVSIDDFLSYLKDIKVHIAGFTGITIDQPFNIELERKVKAISPDILTVVGGHHATMMPEDFYHSGFNVIMRGHGHNTVRELIKMYLDRDYEYSKIIGAYHQAEPGKIYESLVDWRKNIIDAPPSPFKHLRDKDRYRCFGKKINVVVTAQGCPGRCTFCSCWPATGGEYIVKSPEQVVEEIEGTKEFDIFFGDDHTFGDVERMKEVGRLIKNKNIKKRFDGYCRADLIAENPLLFEEWAKIGLRWLTVGFETDSDQGLKKLGKKSTVEINEEANQILLRNGIVNLAHFLIDPDFTRNDFERKLEYVLKHKITEGVFPITTPLPGTILWRKHKDEVKNVPYQYFDLAHPLTAMKLPIGEFYQEYFKLIRRAYSGMRYFRDFKTLYRNKTLFSWPVTAGLNRWMIKSQLTPEKIRQFEVLLQNARAK